MKTKKGQAMSTLAGLAVGIATLAIVLTVTFLVMSQGKAQIVSIENAPVDSANYNASLAINATSTLQSAVDDIPGCVPLIIIGVVGAVLLGLVKLFRN